MPGLWHTPPVDPAAQNATLRTAAARIGEIASTSPDAALTAYPGRDVLDLVCHVLTIHEWVAGIVGERLADRPESRTEYDRTFDDIHERYDATWRHLADLLEAADPDDPVWTFGTSKTVRFWQGRMAHETAIHRWDAERAIDADPPPVPTAVAVSGLAEGLRIHFERLLRRTDLGGGGATVALRCLDHRAAWTLTIRDVGVEVTDGSTGDADGALEGTASELWLAMAGRIPIATVARDALPAIALVERAVAALPPAI